MLPTLSEGPVPTSRKVSFSLLDQLQLQQNVSSNAKEQSKQSKNCSAEFISVIYRRHSIKFQLCDVSLIEQIIEDKPVLSAAQKTNTQKEAKITFAFTIWVFSISQDGLQTSPDLKYTLIVRALKASKFYMCDVKKKKKSDFQ